MPDKSTTQVVLSLKQFAADHNLIKNIEFLYMYIERVLADAGSQFTSAEFKAFCQDSGICLSMAAPKKQAQNH